MTSPQTLSGTGRDIGGLLVWLALAYAAAAVGAVASVSASSFYAELSRPTWSPPAWLFGPVWTTLYALMGISAWRVWRVKGFAAARVALLLFVVQLVANAIWSWLFFAWREGALAFVGVVVLWILIAATVFKFWQIKPIAALLLVPYLAWVTFAAALTYSVWQRNPQLLG